jgi:HEAT repeat protein
MLELVRALAIAWKNLAAYPAGHPALAASMALAHRRLQDLLSGSGAVTLGVARDGLVCGQEKVTSSHARDLARGLYLREVALLRFEPGVTAEELEGLLRSISLDAARSDAPPLADQLAAAGVTHVQVEAVDFSQVRVTDDMSADAPAPVTLWDDLLRAILAGHTLSPEGRRIVDSGEARTPRGLAAILQEAMGMEAPGETASAGRAGERARLDDRLSQVVGKHFSGASAERMLAANQIAEIVRALPEDIRGALVAAALQALAADESAADALKVLADSVTPDTVLQALHRIKEQVPLSSHALRLLHALSATAPSLGARQIEAPDPALLAELSVLFQEDDIDRYNPEDHKQFLTYTALDVPNPPEVVTDLGERMMTLTDDAVTDHMANASVELLIRLGSREGTDVLLSRIEGLFRDCVSRGRLEAAVLLVEDLKAVGDDHAVAPAVQSRVDTTIARLVTAESVQAILDALNRRGPESATLGRRLLDALGSAAARGFLIALAEETDKSRRRRILEMLGAFGPVIAGPATELLGDTQWYVVRNMIVLLHRVGDRSALPEVRVCATHPDLRVRLEAIKYLLAFDPQVPRDLLARAIHDPDPKMAEAAVTLAGNYGIKEAVEPLLEIVADWDVLGRRRSIRVKALKALGELADPGALPRLERFFRNWLVPVVSLDERRTAYRSLQAYPVEARTPFVERGMRSRDEEIRRICLNLSRVRPAPPAPAEVA